MGVFDGQAVSAAVTNPAFLDANANDVALGVIGLQNTTDPFSGPFLVNIQRAFNTLFTTTGATETTAGTTYSAPASTITDGTSHQSALTALANKFHPSTGHKHTGAAGDAPPVSAIDVATVRLHGYIQQGTDLTGVVGTSTDVSTQMSGKTNSTGITVKGVVVTAPNNKIVIRQASGTNTDDEYKDAFGNIVYGRLTYSASVWTLSYYVEISGTETAYTFVSSDVRWYYQELFNPITDAPVYSEFASIPSDNATADIITATTSLQGKVQLSSSAGADIGSSGSAGTANATVANADHTHRGVLSVNKNGATTLYGAVTLSGGTAITLTQTSQDISIAANAASTGSAGVVTLASAAAADVGSSGTAGTANGIVANADHVHRGVLSVNKNGATTLYGAVTLSGSTTVTLTQTSQDVSFSVPTATTSTLGAVQLASAAAADVASAGSAGTANGTVANADHAHRGAFTVKKSGAADIFGTITLTGGNAISLTQTSNDITIAANNASTSTPGVVSLSSTAAADVGSSGTAGTASGSVANADHVHRGILSVNKTGGTTLYGAVTLTQGTNITLTQTGQAITFDVASASTGTAGVVTLASAAAADVGSSGSAGTANGTVANANHVHRGVLSVNKNGATTLYGAVTLTGTSPVVLTQTSQDIAISVNTATTSTLGIVQLASAAAADVGSSGSAGTANGTVANADHVHRGVLSMNKNGATTLYGAVTISAGTGITLTQTGQDISIAASGGGGGGGAQVMTGSRASPQNITAAGGITYVDGSNPRQTWFVQGNGAHIDITANPQISAGTNVGYELWFIGRNNDQTLKFENGTGLSMNGECYLGADDVLAFMWDGTNWVELFRSGA